MQITINGEVITLSRGTVAKVAAEIDHTWSWTKVLLLTGNPEAINAAARIEKELRNDAAKSAKALGKLKGVTQ